jgi:hypothetical protein
MRRASLLASTALSGTDQVIARRLGGNYPIACVALAKVVAFCTTRCAASTCHIEVDKVNTLRQSYFKRIKVKNVC